MPSLVVIMKRASLPVFLQAAQQDLSAQALLLLTPQGKVLRTVGEPGLAPEPMGIALAQTMAAFYRIVAKGTGAQVFFAYEKGDYHLVCSGKSNTPFLAAIYHSIQPPPLGARKFYLSQTYRQSGLEHIEEPADMSLEAIASAFFGEAAAFAGEGHEELLEALKTAAEDMQARLVLAADEGGNTIEVTGDIRSLPPAEISALAALSMAALWEAVPTQPQDTDLGCAFLDGPEGAVFIAQGSEGILFLSVLPRQGAAGMARLTMKNLLRQEWEKTLSRIETPFEFGTLEEVSLEDLWGGEDYHAN